MMKRKILCLVAVFIVAMCVFASGCIGPGGEEPTIPNLDDEGGSGLVSSEEQRELTNTTPNLYELYEMLLECSSKDYEYVVMEVGSQGLAMGRVDTLIFDYVIFSNLTQDHLDYHITMNNYFEAKSLLPLIIVLFL